MRYHFIKTVILIFLSANLFAEGEIIVFVANNGSEVDLSFQSNTLPKIKQFAEDNEIAFKVKDAQQGVPEGITTLPAIVYQNHLGRSVYVGRFNQEEKVINFVRTAKKIPQTKDELKVVLVQRGWVLENAKSHIELKTKITSLEGSKPKKYDALNFAMQAEMDVVRALEGFNKEEEYEVAPTDRKFYANFYPYLSEEGIFYVTTELYSQFHCHDPIYSTIGKPFKGSWKQKDEVLARAAKDIEKQIDFHTKNPENGDGFDPVSHEVSISSWESLGCGLPQAPEGLSDFTIDVPLPEKWKVSGPISPLDPLIAFSFPPPVDSYKGEVRELAGMLTLDKDEKLTHAKGSFTATLSSLTMGDPDLDEAIKAESVLNILEYPEATFSFEGMQMLVEGSLEFGKMQTGEANGRFSFKGNTVEKKVNAQITPVLDEEGNPILHVSASFSINLDLYTIEGPDGPAPQNHTVKFMLNFLMEEAN